MIGPGWVPSYRPRAPGKHVARRRRAGGERAALPLPLPRVARGGDELPVARLRVRAATRASVAAALVAWLGAQATFLRPRALPAVVAVVGLLGILAWTDYLARAPSAPPAAAHREPGWTPSHRDMQWQHVALASPTAPQR